VIKPCGIPGSWIATKPGYPKCSPPAHCLPRVPVKLPESMSRNATPVIRLPRFMLKRSIGAGDVVAGLTAAAGIPPCYRCYARSDKMTRWAVLVPRDRKRYRQR